MVVKLLLEKGADIGAKTSDGETALMGASACARPEIVQTLIARGADIYARTNKGETVLDVTKHNLRLAGGYFGLKDRLGKYSQTITLLKQAGAGQPAWWSIEFWRKKP
jgi:hypothetical protein